MSLIVRVGLTLAACFIASSAGAVDGVLEINQACASGSGCFPGDTAGFPVQIIGQGSYRLTSNLIPPNQGTTVISISAGGVEVDLNGFAIQGTNGDSGPGNPCSAPGAGVGVFSGVRQVAVKNGHVRGMGADGIVLTNTAHVERIVAENNCGDGVRVGRGALVIDTIARGNFRDGIQAESAAVVRNCVANTNSENGINGPSGDIVVGGCVANSNGLDGVFVGIRSKVQGCLTLDNGDDGIEALESAQLMENVANSNTSTGITLTAGSIASSSALGLNVASGNDFADISSVFVLPTGCNVFGVNRNCPF